MSTDKEETGATPGSAPRRTLVRGPQNPPTAEEALLDPRQGFLHPQEERDGPERLDPRLRALISVKLRTASSIGIGFFAVLVLAYLGLALSTDGGLLAWVIPGLVMYPLIIAVGWFYLRRVLSYDQAYREERDA